MTGSSWVFAAKDMVERAWLGAEDGVESGEGEAGMILILGRLAGGGRRRKR